MIKLIAFVCIFGAPCCLAQPHPLSGAYFGLKPPGMTAELFAKGIVSTDLIEHSAPAFSPGMDLILWGVVERGKPSRLQEMKVEKGIWTTATIPSFGDPEYDDFYPRFSPDGKKLYFSSRRPLPKDFPALAEMWIWSVDRINGKWGQPVPLDPGICEGSEYAHSISKNGTMFFSFRKEGGKIFDIAAIKITPGKIEKVELPVSINSEKTEDGPFISPDESFLIFESGRPGGKGSNDLYICFKQKDGSFGDPINMGDGINTEHSERFAGLSPDGAYLFFGSDRSGGAEIYWISSKVIDELK